MFEARTVPQEIAPFEHLYFSMPPIGRTIPWVSRWAQLLQVQRGLTLRIQIVTLNVTHFSDPPIYLYRVSCFPRVNRVNLGSKGASTATSSSDSSSSNYCYLILFNLNKKNNLGAILRSAAAFGVRLVLLVGRQGFKAGTFLGGNVGQGVKDEMDEMYEMNEMN